MKLDNELKLNGTQVLKSRGAFDYSDNSVTYTLDSAITTGVYEISTEGLQDYAGWKTAETKQTASYTVKTTAPTVVSAVAKDKNKVSVEFSAPLQAVGTITINGASVNLNTPASSDANTAASAATSGNLAYVKVENKTVILTFSETIVKSQAETAANYVFKTGTKEFNPATASYDATDNTVTLVFNPTDVTEAGGAFSMTVKNIHDFSVRNNEMATYTKDITFADTKKPTVQDVLVKKGDDSTTYQKLIVSFDKAMNKSSIEDLSNYVFSDNGTTTVLSNWSVEGKKATAVASDDCKSVTITLGGWNSDQTDGSESLGVVAGTDTITVLAVKDSVGNIHQNVSVANSIKASGLTGKDDTILVTFDEKLQLSSGQITALPNNITVTVDGTALDLSAGDFAVENAAGTAAIEADTPFTAFTIKILKDGVKSRNVKVALTSGNFITDVVGNKANAFTAKDVEIADNSYIKELKAPTVTKAKVVSETEVKLTLSESVTADAGALVDTAFTVAESNVSGVELSTDGKTIILTGTGFVSGKVVTYTAAGVDKKIKDANGNVLADISTGLTTE